MGALPAPLHLGEARARWLAGAQDALCADSPLSHGGRPCQLLALAPWAVFAPVPLAQAGKCAVPARALSSKWKGELCPFS